MSRSPHRDSAESNHWLIHEEKPRRRRIDSQAIVEQAHSLVHRGGTAALTMRALAAALRTSPTALYRRFPSKQWLLVGIVDYVFAEVDLSPADVEGMPGRDRLEQLSSSFRDVLAAHPHLHEILTSHVVVTPNTMRIAEAALGCLRDHGIRDAELVDAYNAWCGYVVGFTSVEIKPPNPDADRRLEHAMRTQLKRSARTLPIVNELMSDAVKRAYGLRWQSGRLGQAGTSFEWGLEALLDGFEREKGKPRKK